MRWEEKPWSLWMLGHSTPPKVMMDGAAELRTTDLVEWFWCFFFALGDLTPYSQWCFFNGLFTYYPLTAGWILRRTKETEAAKPMLRKQGWAKNFGVAAERKKTKNRAPGAGVGWGSRNGKAQGTGDGAHFLGLFLDVCRSLKIYMIYMYLYIYIYIYDII